MPDVYKENNEEIGESNNFTDLNSHTIDLKDTNLPEIDRFGDEEEFFRSSSTTAHKRQEKNKLTELINGVNYSNHRRGKRKPLTFNNEEPVGIALKKMMFEIVIVLLVFAVVAIFFTARQFAFSTITNNEISNLESNGQISNIQSVEGLNVISLTENSVAGLVEILANWNVSAQDDFSNISPVPSVLHSQLEDIFLNREITLMKNQSNDKFIKRVYEEIVNGNPVLVTLSTLEGDDLTYAIISSINIRNNSFSLTYSDGTTVSVATSDFIKYTRFDNAEDISIMQKIYSLIGIFDINTAIYFSDK